MQNNDEEPVAYTDGEGLLWNPWEDHIVTSLHRIALFASRQEEGNADLRTELVDREAVICALEEKLAEAQKKETIMAECLEGMYLAAPASFPIKYFYEKYKKEVE